MLKTLILFALTAVCEILGCFLPAIWLKDKSQLGFLALGILCLATFVWLLSLHPVASGKVYATYGGVYIATALLWLRFIDKVPLLKWDYLGIAVVFLGVLILLFNWQQH